MFRTNDGGSTFQRLGNVESVDGLGVDFTDDLRQTLVVGLHEQPKVLRSADGGQSWQDISSGLPAGVGFASFPYVIDRNTYLLGTRSGTASAVLRTVDAGATWSVVHQGGVSGPMLHSPSDGNFYWLLEDGHGVIASSDGGVTWTEVDASGPAGGSAGGLVELPGRPIRRTGHAADRRLERSRRLVGGGRTNAALHAQRDDVLTVTPCVLHLALRL